MAKQLYDIGPCPKCGDFKADEKISDRGVSADNRHVVRFRCISCGFTVIAEDDDFEKAYAKAVILRGGRVITADEWRDGRRS